MDPRDLVNKLHDEPFKPFRIRLSNNSTLEVLDRGMVIVSPTSAVMPVEYTHGDGLRLVLRWKTVALSHMVKFSDIDERE